MRHENAPLGSIHVPYNWTFVDASERIAYNTLSVSDIGKLAYQLDDNSLWILTNYAGTWKDLTGADLLSLHTQASNPHPQYLQHNESLGFPLTGTLTTINHNLNRPVSVTLYTTGGVEFDAEVVTVSTNQVQVLLDYPLDGYAIIQ